MFNGTEAIITRNHLKLQRQLFDPPLLVGLLLSSNIFLYFLYIDTVMTFFGLIPAQQSPFVSALLYKWYISFAKEVPGLFLELYYWGVY